MSETHEDRLPGAPASSADGIVSDLAKVLSSARNADMGPAGRRALFRLQEALGWEDHGMTRDIEARLRAALGLAEQESVASRARHGARQLRDRAGVQGFGDSQEG